MSTINIFTLNTLRQQARRSVTPVSQALQGQVTNSTGGHGWKLGSWDQLNRFLILGVEKGSYYIGEADLLKQNHDSLRDCLREDGLRVVRTIVEISEQGRAFKNDPAIFGLALAAAEGSPEVKATAFQALPKVCRTGTHLYHFVHYVDAFRGWGRGLRKAVAAWFEGKQAEQLAYQMVKYQQRDGWSARDLFRKSHPVAQDQSQAALFRWVIGGKAAMGERIVKRTQNGQDVTKVYPSLEGHLPSFVEAFEEAKTASEKRLVELILEQNLPREAIPTEKLNSPQVWETLLVKMPLAATLRNLGKMTSNGLIKPLSEATRTISQRLKDVGYLRKSRIHPMQVLLASKVYGSGRGIKGSLTWTPVPALLTALDEAFYATFGNVEPVNKPLLIALDVSASMTTPIQGTPISSCEAVAAFSLVHASVEKECHIFGFADTIRELGIRKGMTLQQACKAAQMRNFGSTDISLAIQYAIGQRIKVGGFIVMTDGEVNCGRHPSQALAEYRDRFVPNARSVFVATTANPFTVNDPADKYGLDVAGFDSSIPSLIASFIRGETQASGKQEED